MNFYKEHNTNLSKINKALNLIQRDLRLFISKDEAENIYCYTKLLSHLTTCWTEVRILKLLYEPSGFSQVEINSILSARTAEQKWRKSLNIAISKATSIDYITSQGEISIHPNLYDLLPHEMQNKYQIIDNLISNQLLPSIQLRNRIAHGQWEYAFTGSLKNISTSLTTALHEENIVKLQLRKRVFERLAQLIHDLSVTPNTFRSHFSIHFKAIQSNLNNLHKRNYDTYRQKQIEKYQRGLAKRRQHLNNN